MCREVVCVGPGATLDWLIRLFVVNGISGVPVVDELRRPLGVVSKTDVLGCLASRGGSTQVKEVMTPVTLAMPEHASIARASALMAYEGVHRVVVVDVSGAVIGLVSPIDVLRWLAQKDGYAVP
jgi:CBS domain-containing protein